MTDNYEKFHVGINIFVVKDGKLLLGKRKNVFGAGTWALPGGHLEVGEGMTAAAARELMEETGMTAGKYELANLVNDMSGSQHYIQVGFRATDISGDPELKEPDRCEAWEWYSLGALPENIFPPHQNSIQLFLDGGTFSDR